MVDASAVADGLLHAGAARTRLESDELHVPHLVDTELISTVRRLVRNGTVSEEDAVDAFRTWWSMEVDRYPVAAFVERVWDLRNNLTAADATYIALAEALECTVVTADRKLANAPGPRCPIEVVPR